MILSGKNWLICLTAALVSALAGFSLWISLLSLWPSLFVLPVAVALPVMMCWRYCGRWAGLISGVLAAIFLNLFVPAEVALLMALHLILPSLFVVFVAELRVAPAGASAVRGGRGDFFALSHLVSVLALVSAITTLLVATFFVDRPEVDVFFADMAQLWAVLLREAALYPPQISAQIELILRADIAVSLFALYGFGVPLLNFYIVGRIEEPVAPRPRDNWPVAASRLPRTTVALLIIVSLAALLPLGETVQDCLRIITLILINAFIFCGLAATHLVTRGKTWRPFALTIIYVFVSLPIVSIALAGFAVLASVTPILQPYRGDNHLS